MNHITAATVRRDGDGFWRHPALPEFHEGQERAFSAWKREQGIETKFVDLEDEDPDHPAYIAYFDKDAGTCAEWEPTAPAGEGWFVLAIVDSEYGPRAWFARRDPALGAADAREAA